MLLFLLQETTERLGQGHDLVPIGVHGDGQLSFDPGCFRPIQIAVEGILQSLKGSVHALAGIRVLRPGEVKVHKDGEEKEAIDDR